MCLLVLISQPELLALLACLSDLTCSGFNPKSLNIPACLQTFACEIKGVFYFLRPCACNRSIGARCLAVRQYDITHVPCWFCNFRCKFLGALYSADVPLVAEDNLS